MIHIFDAVRAAIKAAPAFSATTVVTGDATSTPAPYIVLNMQTTDADRGPMSPDEADSLGTLVVTCTAANGEAAARMLEAVEGVLGRSVRVLAAAPGRHVQLRHAGAFGVTVDRSMTLTGTNTHPSFTRVLYDVHSQRL